MRKGAYSYFRGMSIYITVDIQMLYEYERAVQIRRAQILFFRADSHRKTHHFSGKSEKFHETAKQ
jgi:hypothetical protein